MTTDRPDAQRALPRVIHSVPTPRSGVPTAGFGVAAGMNGSVPAPAPVVEPERRSRAVTIVGALLAVVALVAAVVAFRILVPAAPAASATAVEQPADAPRERPGSVVGYGQVYTYADGLEVAVNTPQAYEPSENATGVEQGVPSKVQVVLTNRTEESFRPNTLHVVATSAGEEAVAVWDPDQGVGLTGPDVSVPVGATVQFTLAFSAVDPADLRLEITPALYGYGPMVVQRP